MCDDAKYKKGMAEMPNMKAVLALIASFILLYGCTSGVPQEKYDELASSCQKASDDAALALNSEIAKTSSAKEQLSSCTIGKQSLQSLLSVKEQENDILKQKVLVLDAARAKTDLMAQYDLVAEYYLDAFGPGKVPNNARMKKIDDQVASLGDSGLYDAWVAIKNCQSVSECDLSKAAIIPYIEAQKEKLAIEAASIVGAR
jgi:hypothetical protein